MQFSLHVLTSSPPRRACTSEATRALPFCNSSLQFATRSADLVARLTIEEKLLLLSSSNQPAVQRLGISAYAWGNECLHGVKAQASDPRVGPTGGATIFPQPLAWAATFDADLFRQIGDVISTESRALANYATAVAPTGHDMGGWLNCWTPNMNIFRDPRWGRGSETLAARVELAISWSRAPCCS